MVSDKLRHSYNDLQRCFRHYLYTTLFEARIHQIQDPSNDATGTGSKVELNTNDQDKLGELRETKERKERQRTNSKQQKYSLLARPRQ